MRGIGTNGFLMNINAGNVNEEYLAFAQTIDFTELFKHITSFLGIECAFYQPKISSGGGKVYITFKSKDITLFAGPIASVLRSCYVKSYNNGVFKDWETGKPAYWVNVSIHYEHKDGSENDMDVTRAWYCDGKWSFMDAGTAEDIDGLKVRRNEKKSKKYSWVEGIFDGFRFQAKVYDESSKFGIDNGRVCKLSVSSKIGSGLAMLIINFDKAWEIEPATFEHKALLQRILDCLEKLPNGSTTELTTEVKVELPIKTLTKASTESPITATAEMYLQESA